MTSAVSRICTAVGMTAVLSAAGMATPVAAQPALPLPTSVLPFSADVAVIGDADDQTGVDFQVALKMRNADELAARLAQGEVIEDAEMAQRYWPLQASYDAVVAWLSAQGLAISQIYDNRLTIEVSGTAAAVRRALGVPLKHVVVAGEDFAATETTPIVPAAIAAEVESINGLQPYQHFDKLSTISPSSSPATVDAASSPAVLTGNYLPAGILRVYQALPYLSEDGHGTRTAILIDTFPNRSDLTQFWAFDSIPQSQSNIEFVQVISGTLPAPSGEETLDTEYASSIGYGSKVRVYATKDLTFVHLDTGYQRILSDIKSGVAVDQLSVSLGACEAAIARGEITTENNLLASIAAKRVTILIASGDHGAQECGPGNGLHPSFPATSPFVTAVGGTHLIAKGTPHSQKLTIKSETGWSGSGGGVSGVFATPEYQELLGVTSRAVPDVAADADPATGVVILLDGFTEEVGGTSASTPIWAGFVSLINQERFAKGKKALGQLNPRIYQLLGTADFHDVTAGCNGGYCAGPGYDLVTGIGSPVMNKLLPKLVAQP